MAKTRVLFLVGGRSGEHEISLISGKNVLAALNRELFEPLLVIIQKNGEMTFGHDNDLQKLSKNPKEIKTPAGPSISLRPYALGASKPAIIVESKVYEFDVAFPILHGPGGEDGTIQGLFELAEIPVVGCGVKASAVCMDKAMTKRLCVQANLPVIPFIELHRGDKTPKLPWGFPVFVKPASLGSSLGVAKVKTSTDLDSAITGAFAFDSKILIEPAIVGRELEIAILGKRGDLIASPVGEIKPRAEFYSYDAKYVDPDGAELILPAPISPADLKSFQETAKNIFNTLDCHGMARIDFFRNEKGAFLLNEVNTIPGFTSISMYPKLMQLAGIGYSDLITRLIQLACE